VSLSNGKDVTLLAQFVKSGEERKLFDFQVSHYRMRDVEAAGHPFELRRKKKEEVVLRLDAEHHGLGSGSCGPRTLDEYSLLMSKFEFEVLLQTK
jgi:beta-galactosidase